MVVRSGVESVLARSLVLLVLADLEHRRQVRVYVQGRLIDLPSILEKVTWFPSRTQLPPKRQLMKPPSPERVMSPDSKVYIS